MFATCIFCHSSLGANETIEHFPVGKRLAFDEAKGRLWVVCKKCGRWNLSPIEERWEAIEEAERGFRDTKKRVVTDNIGLARMRDGTDMIRIGAPLRPEFAAWRYGDRFGRRRQKAVVVGGTALLAGAGYVAATSYGLGSALIGTILVGTVAHLTQSVWTVVSPHVTRLTVAANDGAYVKVSAHSLKYAMVSVSAVAGHSGDFTVHVRNTGSTRALAPVVTPNLLARVARVGVPERISGDTGRLALIKILAITNNFSGASKDVSMALTMLEQTRSTGELLRSVPPQSVWPWFVPSKKKLGPNIVLLSRLPAPVRLALEMSLHEDDERRALHGELHELERRWRDAEEIAGIADSLFVTDETLDR